MKIELYVGNISQRVTEEDIVKLFSLVGTVTSIRLIRDAVSDEFKGCGYIRMSTIAQAKDAVETLDGALLVDKVITVSPARPNPTNNPSQVGGARKIPAYAKAGKKAAAGGAANKSSIGGTSDKPAFGGAAKKTGKGVKAGSGKPPRERK